MTIDDDDDIETCECGAQIVDNINDVEQCAYCGAEGCYKCLHPCDDVHGYICEECET